MSGDLHGLAAVIGDSATLHGIEEPPARDEFLTDADFEQAYSAWWLRTHCWQLTTVEEADRG